jgi:thioredoxin 1
MPQQTPLTNASFSEFVRIHKLAVVHFWAIWNGHDVQMKKLIESQIPDDLSESVAFATFDVDPPEHHEICIQHKILNVPFLAFYRDGSLIRTIVGLHNPEVISQYLRELLNESA